MRYSTVITFHFIRFLNKILSKLMISMFLKTFSGFNALQPNTTKIILIIKQVVFITHCSGEEHTPWETTGYLRKKVLKRIYFRI